MISPRTAYRVSLVGALLVLAFAVSGATQKKAPVCGNLAANYEPIIAFELSRSVSDLHAIFGDSAGACRTAIAQQMDAINRGDSAFFIPAYGAFLIFFFLGLRARDHRLATLAIRITFLACAADYVENTCLFHLSVNPDVASGWLSLLMWATEVKWVGLGIANAIGGYVLFMSHGGRWLYRAAIALCLISAGVALMSVPTPAVAGPYLSQAIVLGWIVFLLVDLRESFRRDLPAVELRVA
jgi:hypothetical protein